VVELPGCWPSVSSLCEELVLASVFVVVDGLGVCASTAPASPSSVASPNVCNLIMDENLTSLGG
jgi:hypothetical protein